MSVPAAISQSISIRVDKARLMKHLTKAFELRLTGTEVFPAKYRYS